MKVTIEISNYPLTDDYEPKILQKEIKTSYKRYGQMIFVVKVLKGELDLNYIHS